MDSVSKIDLAKEHSKLSDNMRIIIVVIVRNSRLIALDKCYCINC